MKRTKGKKAFLDTNILVYLFSDIPSDAEKKNIVVDYISKHNCQVSTQVLNEFSSVCIKKLKMSAESIQILVSRICKYCDLVYINEDTINTALSYHEIYGYAYYDCLILASAVERGCEFIISEDMADGQVIEGVATIKNIFLTNKNKGKDS